MDPTLYDHPPNLEQLAAALPLQFDPWKLARHEYTPRADNCGSMAIVNYKADYTAFVTTCSSIRCIPCAKYRIDGKTNDKALRRQYDAMDPPIFSTWPAVHLLTVPYDPEADPTKVLDAVSARARRRNVTWHRVQADVGTGASFYFSDGDLQTAKSPWPTLRLHPDTARDFLLAELLQPGVMYGKPESSQAFPWALPADGSSGGGGVRCGAIDRELKDDTVRLAGALLRDMVRHRHSIDAEEHKELVVRGYKAAAATVLAERDEAKREQHG
jgi:hypothetical protein